jgi:hypothetical protein
VARGGARLPRSRSEIKKIVNGVNQRESSREMARVWLQERLSQDAGSFLKLKV